MRASLGARSATLIVFACLIGCTAVPPPRPTVVAPPGIELPIPATVLYEIAPNQRDFNVSSLGPYTWGYREAPLMSAAATAMMHDMFSDVVVADGPIGNGIVFQLSGYTSINPAVSMYYATAIADVFVRTEAGERQIGQYRGIGSAWGLIYSYPPLETAYAAAFSELSRQMLADPELIKRFPTKSRK